MSARGPSLVLRAVETSAVAGGTVVATVFSPLLCRHPYLLRSSVGLCGSLVKVAKSCARGGAGFDRPITPRASTGYNGFPKTRWSYFIGNYRG